MRKSCGVNIIQTTLDVLCACSGVKGRAKTGEGKNGKRRSFCILGKLLILQVLGAHGEGSFLLLLP